MHAAQADTAPVLISGASGTGKGAIARWIHANSPRCAKPVVVCTRDSLLGEELPKAQGGSLLISEIGEMPRGEQRVLLDFLNTHSIPQPGNPQARLLLNVRILATTDQGLEGRAQGGLFNGELLEKLNVFRLEMPPLAGRADEFDDIALGILSEITRELHKEHIRELTPEAWIRLRKYDWPGNLRELRNVLRVAIIACESSAVRSSDLPDFGHDRMDFRATREQFERTYILELLKTFNWEIEKTCRMSRMDRTTLLAKIRKYGIEIPESSL